MKIHYPYITLEFCYKFFKQINILFLKDIFFKNNFQTHTHTINSVY